MDRLWAPWRMKYILTVDQTEKGCIFCVKPPQDKDEENLILTRGKHCYVILNRYPYNNGHLMVVPFRHVATLQELSDPEKLELMQTVDHSVQVLQKVLRPDGCNVGINLGRTAGAGIGQHLHVHVVPRWNGDTNFMPILGEAKVISESLAECYRRLLEGFGG